MISRHYIDIPGDSGTRRVHYRKAGSGPPLLMVHQSPRSSAEYEPLMQKWSEHFTCIAPDTPGFGQSDPLTGEPEIGDFADAQIELLDALGVEKCAAYGFHSGGIILVTAIKKSPERFTTLAVGGYAIWSPEEMALFSEKYLPEFHPSAYGEHLTWLWNRILEQTWFFPWFAADDDHRLTVAHDRPELVDAVIRDMLDAGNAYRAGYGAVLRAPREIPKPEVKAPPCLISAYDGDPLQEHIDRLDEMPETWSAQKVASPEDHQNVSLKHLLATKTPNLNTLNETSDAGFVHIQTIGFDGLIHWQGNPQSDILKPNPPGRAWSGITGMDALYIEMPGHGLSDDWQSDAPTHWSDWQNIIDACCEQFGAKDVKLPDIRKADPDQLYPDLTPDRFGHYLQTAWQVARAEQFFWPWYKADKDHAILVDQGAITSESFARRHLDLLKARSAKQYHIALQSSQET